jgi:hypothetical protein
MGVAEQSKATHPTTRKQKAEIQKGVRFPVSLQEPASNDLKAFHLPHLLKDLPPPNSATLGNNPSSHGSLEDT